MGHGSSSTWVACLASSPTIPMPTYPVPWPAYPTPHYQPPLTPSWPTGLPTSPHPLPPRPACLPAPTSWSARSLRPHTQDLGLPLLQPLPLAAGRATGVAEACKAAGPQCGKTRHTGTATATHAPTPNPPASHTRTDLSGLASGYLVIWLVGQLCRPVLPRP